MCVWECVCHCHCVCVCGRTCRARRCRRNTQSLRSKLRPVVKSAFSQYDPVPAVLQPLTSFWSFSLQPRGRSAQQVFFERCSSLSSLRKRCCKSQPSSEMNPHRSSLVRTPLMGLRRLLCSLYVPAVTGLTTLEHLSTANFSAAFECPQSRSLRSIVSP